MFQCTFCWLILLQAVSTTTGLYSCPAGWMLNGSKCYKAESYAKSFHDAELYCRNHNANIWLINNAKENNFFKEESDDACFWMGLTWQQSTRQWMHDGKPWIPSSSYKNFLRSDYQSSVNNYNTYCVCWRSRDRFWDISVCNERKSFICERDGVCVSGYFGSKCSRTCHCHGEICKPRDRTCKYGCQKRWMGKLCDKPKVQATALYYCLKTNQNESSLVLRVDQHGINYKRVFAVDKDGNPLSSCNKSSFSSQDGKLQLTIKHSPSTDFEPDCGTHHISNQTYKWKFHFVEFPGIFSIYDVIFEVTCDFEKADNLERGLFTYFKKNGTVKTLSKTDLHVELTIQDPYTTHAIKTAQLDQNVQLVMQLWGPKEDMAVKKISPHSCMVGTEDGVHAVSILDYNGCSNKNAPCVFSEGNGTTWWSQPFNTFTFPGYTQVIFACHFDICFNDDDRLCNDRCLYMTTTSNKRTQHQTMATFGTGSKKTATMLNVV